MLDHETMTAQQLERLTHDQLVKRCLLLQKQRDDVARDAERKTDLHARTLQFVFNVNEKMTERNRQLYAELQEMQVAASEPAQKKLRTALDDLSAALLE